MNRHFLGSLPVLALCGLAGLAGCDAGRIVRVNTVGDDASVPMADLSRPVDLGPCGGPCSGDTPWCDTKGGKCVGCLNDQHCPSGMLCHGGTCANGCTPQRGCGDAGVCQQDGGVCVECLIDADCTPLMDPQRRVCNAATGRCVRCRPGPGSDTCGANEYCKDDGNGGFSCASGCKGDGDCFGMGNAITCCNHACVDIKSSAAHCGQCGKSCGNDPDAACCSSVCVRTGSDVNACGGCGKVCMFVNASGSCSGGACKIGACMPGFDDCNKDASDGCETGVASDIKNCGACGKPCSTPNANALCVLGQCTIGACLQGFRDCDGMPGNGCEINAQSDPNNCGACGSACAQLPKAVAACMAASCVVGSCTMGFGNCDKMDANGCETDLSSSVQNCGACGIGCVVRPNYITNCVAAKCVDVGCTQGFADCDNNLNNGCEATLATDANNCGACGRVCQGGGQNAMAGCVMGVCSLVCSQGFGDCDNSAVNGCEKDLRGDVANCGACGKVCPANLPFCQAGVCNNVPACHGPFAVNQTINLDINTFTAKHNNFHPQSIDYDPVNNQIVFALQGTQTARWVDLNGVLVGSTNLPAVVNNSMQYTNGIAIDATYLFIADYTGNASTTDLARYTRSGQFGLINGTNPSAEILAYGGYPLALGGGNLFRGNFSNTYDWASIKQIRVAAVNTPDNIIRTLDLTNSVTRGIGDLAWDGSAIWVSGWSNENGAPNRAVDLWRIDPNNGAVLESYVAVFTMQAPLRPAGVAYGNNSLYIFGYAEVAGTASTLTRMTCK